MKIFLLALFVSSLFPDSISSSYPMIGVTPDHRFQSKVILAVNEIRWDFPVRISPFSGALPFRINDSDFVVFAGKDLSSGQSFLYCLNDEGRIWWRVQLPESVIAMPAIDKVNQQVIVSVGDSLMAFSLLNGNRVWAVKLKGLGWHPTIYHNFLLLTEGSYLSAYNLENGNLRWRVGPLGGGLFNTTATVDTLYGFLYIGTLANSLNYYDWKVYSFDTLGNQRWVCDYLAFEPGGIRMTMALISLNKVVHHNYWLWGWSCGVYLVDSSGVKWRYGPIGFQTFYSSIAFNSQRLAVGTSEGLLILDTLGQFIRLIQIGPITYSSPLFDSSNKLLVGTDEGKFYVVDFNGQVIFQYVTSDGPLGSPTIGLNGNVYIAGQRKLYCFSNWVDIKEQKEVVTPILFLSTGKIYNVFGRLVNKNKLLPGIYFDFKRGKKIVIR